jgi:hypothetical protein
MNSNDKKEDPDWTENRRLRYQEAGEWARHYSSVRMTVVTFVITTCVAILALKWDPEAHNANSIKGAYVGNLVAILWLLGIAIFQIFTFHTYDRLSRQLSLKCQLKYHADPSTDDANKPCEPKVPWDHASWAIFVLSTVFACFIGVVANEAILCPIRCLVYIACPESLLFPIWLYYYLNYLKKSSSTLS